MAESKWTRHEVQFRGVPNESGKYPLAVAEHPDVTPTDVP